MFFLNETFFFSSSEQRKKVEEIGKKLEITKQLRDKIIFVSYLIKNFNIY